MNSSDPLWSRFLAFAKADVLLNDQRLKVYGEFFIQIYLLDNNADKTYYIYDKRGFSEEIVENLETELRLIDAYIHNEDNRTVIEDQ